VILKLPVLKVPAVTVIALVLIMVNALPNVHAPPVPLNVKAEKLALFVVIVFPVVVAAKVMVQEFVLELKDPEAGPVKLP